jgi:CTP synthase
MIDEGKTVEEVPHVTDEIIRRIKLAAEKTGADVLLVELGSTVGDIKGAAFIEAFRQMRHKVGRKNTLFVHVTLLPYMGTTGELKTRPTQYGVRELMSLGIPPHILVCRAEKAIPDGVLDKIRDHRVQRAVVAGDGRAFGAQRCIEMHAFRIERRPRGFDRVQGDRR